MNEKILNEMNNIVDKLLNMDPDPIPRFILLKEFKKLNPSGSEYQNAYDMVCSHKFVKDMAREQNERGFWPPFHGYTEDIIRRCLTFGLGSEHDILKRVSAYIKKVLENEESWDQFEKQDNARWWPEMFVPLVSAAMLSLIEPDNEILRAHRQRWAYFAETAFSKGAYDSEAESRAQTDYFNIKTKRTIPAYNYYVLLLLAPTAGEKFISDNTDKALVDYCMNVATQIYYVYNCNLSDFVPIDIKRRDSRDFCHWLRALSIVSKYQGWKEYEEKYAEWVLSQRNSDGLWELENKPRRFDFPLSDSWRTKKNRVIDSSIMVLRFINRSNGF
ncbi:MAG TPA: hypothetical protein VIL05_12950 [Thermoclostridium sp.]